MKKQKLMEILTMLLSFIKALREPDDKHYTKVRSKIKSFLNFIEGQRINAHNNIKALGNYFDNRCTNALGKIKALQKSMKNHCINVLRAIKALRIPIKEHYNKALDTIIDLWDSIEDYCIYAKKAEKKMNPAEMETFTTVSCYAFTLMLIAFIIALPIMIFRGYTFVVISITLLTVGFALPATLLVVLRKYYWIISCDVSELFQIYSLPLIGRKETDGKICKMQLKLFKPLRKTSIIIVSCYMLMNLSSSNSLNFLSMFFKILLSGISWTGVAVMALDGIYMYSSALWKIGTTYLQTEHKKPKRVRNFCLDDIWNLQKNIFIWKHKYVPKRLAVQNTSIKENNFSFKTLVEELRTGNLGARVKSV